MRHCVLNYWRKYWLFWTFLGVLCTSQAQTTDTLPVDSSFVIYEKIKTRAFKHKLTRLVYDAIFVNNPTTVITDQDEHQTKSNRQKRKDPNTKYTGRLITKIEIVVFDPFGHNINDTIIRKINRAQRFSNSLHVRTNPFVIRNLLLFRENEPLDILEISESERILREAKYVGDARIHVYGGKHARDGVTVRVLVHDRWSWDVAGNVNSVSSANATFRDRNFGGMGLAFEQYAGYDYKTKLYEYRSSYGVTSIGNSYIGSTVFYLTKNDISQAGISFDRPFYSPLAKWAGGASALKTWSFFPYIRPDSVQLKLFLDYINTDLWVGRSFNPSKKRTNIDQKSRNIGISLRFANTYYEFKPSYVVDTQKLNINTSLYMGSVGYSVRKYYKDKYIYRFGANEDIPEGTLVQLVYGLRTKEESKDRYYLGLEASRGRHFEKLGYLSGTLSYGTFFNKSEKSEMAMNLGVFYFSNSLSLRRWKLRQFLNYKLVYGIEKSTREYISLRGDEMNGFDADTLRGSRKMVLSLETVLYAPFKKLGFSFAPIVLMTFGMLDRERARFFDTQVYQSYAVGLLIRNENLISSSFQFTVGAYPVRVAGHGPLFKANPVTSFVLRVYGFAITRPSPVVYQ